jgi:hypothetical protein
MVSCIVTAFSFVQDDDHAIAFAQGSVPGTVDGAAPLQPCNLGNPILTVFFSGADAGTVER